MRHWKRLESKRLFESLTGYILYVILLAVGLMQPTKSIFFPGSHVRASAGDLAVHGALIVCVRVFVCVCVCACVRVRVRVCPVSKSFLITPRIGTKVVSVDR